MPTEGFAIIPDRDGGHVRFLRTNDRRLIDYFAHAASSGHDLPGYEHFLRVFADSASRAFVYRRGLVLLADEGRLVEALTTLTRELLADFAHIPGGEQVAALTLAHFLHEKLEQPPDAEALGQAIEAARQADPKPLRRLVDGAVRACTCIERADRWSLPRLLGWRH